MITRYHGLTRSAFARRLEGDVFESPTISYLFITKDVKNCSYLCYVRCATLIVRVWVMSWPQTGAAHYHEKLGLPEKSRAFKELIVEPDFLV